MLDMRVRRPLGLVMVVLGLAGFAPAQATEGDGPPSAGPLGNAWYTDPPYTPAGALATATWEAPDPIASTPNPPEPDGPTDLPSGIPKAARKPEPVLFEPDTWTFGDGFPRTSGTGRYFNGAYFWSDFIYDDNGAVGAAAPTNESTGAPGLGTYKYPEPEALRNGSDIFRVAVGRGGDQSIWRVDWNTLADSTFPIAAFTIDSDPATGVDAWPANTGLTSPGIDWAVVMSGTSARVIDLVHPDTPTNATLEVDDDARSFVVTTSDIPVDGSAVVRVASGIADAGGTGFLTLDSDHGAAQGQPNVYNVAYRDYSDEPSQTNLWYDTVQARVLTAGGDVSSFAATVNWDDLGTKKTEDEIFLPGYTNRWYVSSWTPTPTQEDPNPQDQGIVDPGQGISTDGPAAYVGRIQPYGIFVPTTYRATVPSSLTWMLHGASSSHNSTQVHPRFFELACERRNSICVSPLGRGPSGGWRNYAELDFWEVWNRVATAYTLDPERTILSGISMGAFGTYKIAMDHPEAFAAAVTIVGNATGSDTGLDRLTNLRWIPLYARHGAADELVNITTEIQTQDALNALGLRHVYDFQPAEDHIVVALKDAYDDVAEFMASIDARAATPPRISLALTPQSRPADRDFEATHGLDRPGAWWLRDVTPRDNATKSRIEATSFAIEDPEVKVVQRDEPRALGSPSPTLRHVLEWQPTGNALVTSQELDATVTNVSRMSIALAQAKLGTGSAKLTLDTTDGPVTLTLLDLGDRKLVVDGQELTLADTVTLAQGAHVIQID